MESQDQEEPKVQPQEPAGAAAAAGQEPDYPPETYRWMSWAAILFINRPSSKALAGTCYLIMAMLALGFVSTFFIRLNVRVQAAGDIVADLGVLQTVAQADGLMAAPAVAVGAPVAKGDVLGFLQMDMEPARLAAVMAACDGNVLLVDAVDRKTGLSDKMESGTSLADIRDDSVREAAAALQNAVRRLQKSLASLEPFEGDKSEVIRLSRQLKGMLVRYLEHHQLRSPASGVVMQYEVPTNANVRAGDVVATILPQGAALVARMPLDANDMATIAVGQKVRYKVDAYPYQRYGLFEGAVLSIERAQQDKGMLHYEVRASLRNPATISARLERDVHLVMGMRFNGQIITGTRTVFDILADSLFKRS